MGAGHVYEQGLTVAGVNTLREMSGLPSLGPITSWYMKTMPPKDGITEQLLVPVTLTPDNISEARSLAMNNPHNVHLHLWSPASMRHAGGCCTAARAAWHPLCNR